MQTLLSLYSSFKQNIRHLADDESAASAIEYAIIAGVLAAAVILGAQALGVSIGTLFTNITTALDGL